MQATVDSGRGAATRATEAIARRGGEVRDRLAHPRDRRGRAIGWLSVGLGLVSLAAPRLAARIMGLDRARSRGALRAVGLRELACGVGLLAGYPTGSILARVAGDAMDLAALGRARRSRRGSQRRLAISTVAVLGLAAIDLVAGRRLRRRDRTTLTVTRAITVRRPVDEVYAFWRDLENLPRFMAHLESVTSEDGGRRTHWRAKAPAGTHVEWDAEIVDERPGQLLAWRSCEGADVATSGRVRFVPAPGGRGTEVHVELSYEPPGGRAGQAVAKLFGEEPGQQVEGDLRRFKQVLECGDVVRSDASVHRGMHAAQPGDSGMEARR